jgi:uridine kinase
LECRQKERLQRRIQRDVTARGRTMASVKEQFCRDVRPMERRYVVGQRRWADLVLTSPVAEPQLHSLAARIQQLLVDSPR